MSLNSVYRWEHDLTAPKKTTLKRIAAHYEVPLEWLLQEDADERALETINDSSRSEHHLVQQLLKMFNKLSENKKYKILGYIERIYIEDMDNISTTNNNGFSS